MTGARGPLSAKRYPWPSWLLVEINDRQVAETLGVTVKTVRSCRQRGLTEFAADKVAVRVLRLHPACVWSDWILDGLEVAA